MTVHLSVPQATLPAHYARRHAQRLRDYASQLLLHELDGSPLPTVAALEEIIVAFESQLRMPEPTDDPAPKLRAVGAL